MILVSFLGIGNYQTCEQFHHSQPEDCVQTPYVQSALAQLARREGDTPTEIRILATNRAWQTHGETLTAEFDRQKLPTPVFLSIPDGGEESDFWDIFAILRTALQGKHVLLDITHGFRAQPFFAAAVVQYLSALNELPTRLQMHYGQLSDDHSQCRIWDLSAFLTLQMWSGALDSFLRYGKGQALTSLSQALEASQRRELAREQNQHLINARPLINELKALCDAISTVRVPHIVSPAHYENHTGRTPTAHAASVSQQIFNCRDSINDYLPALAPLLDKLHELLVPLQGETLQGASSLRAQQALAQQYLRWNCPAEASIVLREANVSRYANGSPLDGTTRFNAERHWFEMARHECQSLGNLRNDIQHGGWREKARRGNSLLTDLKKKIESFKAEPVERSISDTQPTVLIITRHPSALTWLRTQGLPADIHHREHIDENAIQNLKSGDIVVGTLPIHLAARVCEKGAHFRFLALTIPDELRGQELNHDQFMRCDPQLLPYRVEALSG